MKKVKIVYKNIDIPKANKAGIGPNNTKTESPNKLKKIHAEEIINKTAKVLKPISNNKWWICLLSGLKGLYPKIDLLIVTETISNTGIVTHQIVKIGCSIGLSDWEVIIKNQETKKPKNKLPESPRKILNLLDILKIMKIKIFRQIKITNFKSLKNSTLPVKNKNTIIDINDIKIKEPHKPSTPSIKLKAFVSPITQKTVNRVSTLNSGGAKQFCA